MTTTKSKKTSVAKSPKARRLPKRLCHVMYAYAEPINGKHAREYGKKHFGSFSAYIDALIAADRKEKFISVPIVISKLKKKVTQTAKAA